MATHRTVNPEIWDKLTHQAKWRDLCIVAIESWGYFYLLIQENMATLTDLKNSNIELRMPSLRVLPIHSKFTNSTPYWAQ